MYRPGEVVCLKLQCIYFGKYCGEVFKLDAKNESKILFKILFVFIGSSKMY